MNIKIELIGVLVFIAISNTQGQKSSFRDYYFPVNELINPKVYVYENQTTSEKDYWMMITQVIDGDTIFTTNYFDDKFQIREITTELIGEDWATMIRSQMIVYDDKNQMIVSNCFIPYNKIFEFGNESRTYRFKFITDGPYEFELIGDRNRVNTTKRDGIVYERRRIECVKIEDTIVDKYMNEKGEIENMNKRTEIHLYGQGVGRIRTTILNDEEELIRQLVDIIDVKEFQKLIESKK